MKGKPRSAFTRTELEILFSLPDTTEKLGWRDLVLFICNVLQRGACTGNLWAYCKRRFA